MATDIIDTSTNGTTDSLRELLKDLTSQISEDPEIINCRNELGKSALDMTAILGKSEMSQELILSGADVNGANSFGYTALHQAAIWGRKDCLKVLIEAGADLNKRTDYNERPRECAARYGQRDCIDLLDTSEAQLNLRNVIQSFKEMIADPEKHLGKLSKEDKTSGNRACDEKLHWLETNKTTATVEEISASKNRLEEILQPIFTKLKEKSDLSVSSKSRTRSIKSPHVSSVP